MKIQIITQHIVRKVQIKRETVVKERIKQAKSIANVVMKVKSITTGKKSKQVKDVVQSKEVNVVKSKHPQSTLGATGMES